MAKNDSAAKKFSAKPNPPKTVKQEDDMKSLREFMVKISILPISIAVVFVMFVIYVILDYYLKLMVENSSEMVLLEISLRSNYNL